MSIFNSKTKTAVSIKVEEVSKTFGSHTVLEKLNLSVSPGEVFVLMGPSGTGKSVFLKLLSDSDTYGCRFFRKSSPHCLYCRDTRQEMHPICRNRLQLFSIYILLFTAIEYYYNKQGI